MQWPRQALQAGAVAEERVAQSAADEVGCVSRYVATLVIPMQRQVEAQQVLEALVFLTALPQHGGKVVRPVLARVDVGRQGAAAAVGVLVDLGGDGGQLGQ